MVRGFIIFFFTNALHFELTNNFVTTYRNVAVGEELR